MSLDSTFVSLQRWSLHFVGSQDDLRAGSGSALASCCSTNTQAQIPARCYAAERRRVIDAVIDVEDERFSCRFSASEA